MPLQENDFATLKQTLPIAFSSSLSNDDEALLSVSPLLAMTCKDQEVINQLRTAMGISFSVQLTEEELMTQSIELCDVLIASNHSCQHDTAFKYRLPMIIGEFPIHTRAIYHAIKQFNQLIEDYHSGHRESLDRQQLEKYYENILTEIKQYGSECDKDSLWQLLGMMVGWSTASNKSLFEKYPCLLYPPSDFIKRGSLSNRVEEVKSEEISKPVVVDSKLPNRSATQNPFIQNYNYNFNRAGRLANETDTLLLNAFGMKVGGHFDAQVKYVPKFIPVSELHAIIERQLSHRMLVPVSAYFKVWIENTLADLGVEYKSQSYDTLDSEKFVNPFIAEPISFLNPEKISSLLKQNLDYLNGSTNNKKQHTNLHLQFSNDDLDIISQYLFELLQSFQINPGQALGIGANWDGTVNLSNEANAYPFKFNELEADWGTRFKQLSLHRQGPAEVHMNAALGVKFEALTLLTDFDYMSQLQSTEHDELLYNAIVDNLVAELFPEPAYFENQHYKKYKRQFIVNRDVNGNVTLESFYQPCDNGTYFKDKSGAYKQTPMYRRAGTLEVQAFPRDSGCSESSRASCDNNPLTPQQLQYLQAMHGSTRGHIAYDPIAPDQFIPDIYYGQVIRNDNGDILPFIGVVPKNFDKHFKQENELCASFVIRMLQSSRIMEYSTTFRETVARIKNHFLPALDSQLPELPDLVLNEHIIEKHRQLTQALHETNRNFEDCQKIFYALFKNLIYSLYEQAKYDANFKNCFIHFITNAEVFNPISKATCEQLVRYLTVNKPVLLTTDKLKQYETVLRYLSTLISYFYPVPSEFVAEKIAKQAKDHVASLLQSKTIKLYFEEMKQIQQANLSRKQSPGMAYAALKHGGPSNAVSEEYSAMHDGNFNAGYRDPEGNQMSGPENYEQLLDWFAKKVGAVLQLLHKYNLLAVIRRPLTQPYIQANEQSYQAESFKSFWGFVGGIKGFVWDGLLKGLWQTLATPFNMMNDFINSGFQPSAENENLGESPLDLSAAPANEPSLKVKTGMETRDFMLNLLKKSPDGEGDAALIAGKKNLIDYAIQLVTVLYSQLNQEEKNLCYKKLALTFPLTDSEWAALFNPFATVNQGDVRLGTLFENNSSAITRNFTHALFKCVTDVECVMQPKTVIKKAVSFHQLTSQQAASLAEFVNYYCQMINPNQKRNFVKLFQFGGQVQWALRLKDQYLHKIQNWTANVFDEQWLLETLFESQVQSAANQMAVTSLMNLTKQLPDCIKAPLLKLLTSADNSVLNAYDLKSEYKEFLNSFYSVFKTIQNDAEKEAIIACCQLEKKVNEASLSKKDKAHNKWASFVVREIKHALLNDDEVRKIFETLQHKLVDLPDAAANLDVIQKSYQALSANTTDETSLNEFFSAAGLMQMNLAVHINKKLPTDDTQVVNIQTMLRNFVDITLNAVVNTRLDQVDVLDEEVSIVNPLLQSTAIESWLWQVQNNNRDLRSLLEQQVQQSPSLDHALWRNKCILQVLEKNNPAKRIHKTGMQSLIRFWCQHRENVTKSGDVYIDSSTQEQRKVVHTDKLFEGSRTMQYAVERVSHKIPNGLRGKR